MKATIGGSGPTTDRPCAVCSSWPCDGHPVGEMECLNCGAPVSPHARGGVCDESCLLARLEVLSWRD